MGFVDGIKGSFPHGSPSLPVSPKLGRLGRNGKSVTIIKLDSASLPILLTAFKNVGEKDLVVLSSTVPAVRISFTNGHYALHLLPANQIVPIPHQPYVYVTVGRGSGNDLVINSLQTFGLSRQHAVFMLFPAADGSLSVKVANLSGIGDTRVAKYVGNIQDGQALILGRAVGLIRKGQKLVWGNENFLLRPQGINIIGRDPATCSVCLPEKLQTVSREHAVVVLEDGEMKVYDLASLNGTSIEEKTI